MRARAVVFLSCFDFEYLNLPTCESALLLLYLRTSLACDVATVGAGKFEFEFSLNVRIRSAVTVTVISLYFVLAHCD